jgi:purine-binding chemotaxis protein CheW
MTTGGPELRPERGAATAVPTVEGEPALASPATRVPTCLVVLGGEQFAIDVRHLREVMIVEKLTAVPGAPAFLRGLASLRGEVLAILDVAPVLGLPSCGVGLAGKALVIEPASGQVAIVVDEVLGLETFDEIRPPEDTRPTEHAAFGMGWLERDGRPITLLDIPKVVNELKVRSRAAGRRGAGAPPSEVSAATVGGRQR